jgi:cell volume regulation protein A
VHDVEPFGLVIGAIALAVLIAVLANRLGDVIRIPAPALFLAAAALAAEVFPRLGSIPIITDQRVVTVALVVILFDGGMQIGWTRFRLSAGAIAWIGVAGTAVTAGGVALCAHGIFGFDWRPALLLGTALAPTDPAVVFSVLGRREIEGRTGTILQGESGANDPVGIALMVSLLGASGGHWHALGHAIGEFVLQMGVGAVIGALGGLGMLVVMRRVRLPDDALYPIQALALAFLIYGLATVARGSGFLAVFIAGILVGDARIPHQREVEHVSSSLASLGEIVAFTVLGLSISQRHVLGGDVVWTGLGVAALLVLVVRPVLVGLLLVPVRLRRGERAFVLWAGLKGAVPILLGTFVLAEGVSDAGRIYGIVFVVVLVSVVVQGGLVPAAARACRVTMRVPDR